MFESSQKYFCTVLFCYFVLVPFSGQAEELSVSVTVQKNILILMENNGCPQCDLSGADLSRTELSGANLEGANLSRAKFYLSNLSGANLRSSDLRETGFAGADIANADLRGADLRGTSFSGAYIKGALFDGEMVTTVPYSKDKISDVEETVYVDDTVKAKPIPVTEELKIANRRDFEETPPALPFSHDKIENKEAESNIKESVSNTAVVPLKSAVAPTVKQAPSIQEVKLPIVPLENEVDSEHVDFVKQDDVEKTVVLNSKSMKYNISDDNSLKTKEIVQKRRVGAIKEIAQHETISEVETVHDVTPQITEAEKNTKGSQVIDNFRSVPEQENTVINDEFESGTQDMSKTIIVANEVVANKVVVDELIETAVSSVDTLIIQNTERLFDDNQCYGCDFKGVDLQGESFDGADLEGADFSNANLVGVDFEGANLKGAILIGANLKNANLSKADLYKADLTGADLSGANLERTLLDDAVMVGVEGYQQEPLLLVE